MYSSKSGTNQFTEILKKNNNLALANFLTKIDDPNIYDLCQKLIKKESNPNDNSVNLIINQFIDKIVDIYGATTIVTAINGATDVHVLDEVYENLIDTFNTITNCILSLIIVIAITITILISNLVIDDSKRIAMLLKVLGYSNLQNAFNFLSLYIPVILIGLSIAIPITYGICIAYDLIIFKTTNILVNSIPIWWHFLSSLGTIVLTFSFTYIYSYFILKKESLVDNIKVY